MLIVKHIKLAYKQAIINTARVKLDLYEHESGNLVLSANLKHPMGVVYYVTNESLVKLFSIDEITMQELFDMSSSVFIEIVDGDETRLYLRCDIDIMLESGEKKYSEIIT